MRSIAVEAIVSGKINSIHPKDMCYMSKLFSASNLYRMVQKCNIT